MRTFAFISPPVSIEQLKDFWPLTKIMPNFCIRSFLKHSSFLKVLPIEKARSSQGKEIQGYFITLPILPEEIKGSEEDTVRNKIIAASHIVERLGVRILGLGDHVSAIAKNIDAIGNLKVPITCGNILTAWSVFEAIYRMAKIKNIDLKKSVLAIIGAANPIGKLCAKKMADYSQRIIINDADPERLKKIKESILNLSSSEVVVEEDAVKAVKDSDILIVAGHFSEIRNILKGLKPEAIVCGIGKLDISTNATIIEAGLIKLPYPINLKINTGLPKDIVSAALAETMLLTFEERFGDYSSDDDINPEELEEMADLAVQHGFEVWVPQAPVL